MIYIAGSGADEHPRATGTPPVFAPPLGRLNSFAKTSAALILTDDLSIEVFTGIKIETLVGRSGEAVGALMEVSAHRISGPAEAHITGGRHRVELALGEHSVERDAVELWRARGAHKVIEARRHAPMTSQSGAATV